MNFDKIPTIKSSYDAPGQFGFRHDSIMEMAKYIKEPGEWVEFGVSKGWSAKVILKIMPPGSRLYLLDSFEGLPEKWGGYMEKGAFKLTKSEIPVFNDPKVEIIKGWFKDTVKELTQKVKALSFVHIDCDIYSSTIDALFGVGLKLANPCYILFDEFYNYPEYEQHEYLAFIEFIHTFELKYMPLFKTAGSQVAFKIWREI